MNKKEKLGKVLRIFALSALLTLVLGLRAQEEVNEELIKGSDKLYIKPSSKKYLQYTETKEGTVIFQSHLTRNTQYVTCNGKEQLAIAQIYKSNGSINRDSSLCDKHTLKPLAYYSDLSSEGYKEMVSFNGTKIENKTLYKDSVKTTVQVNNGKFNGVITDELVASYPSGQPRLD